jgi:hypothetical protein
MENTSDQHSSNTLSKMGKGHIPDTICTTCQNALWYITKPDGKQHFPPVKPLRVFCKLMHAKIEDDLTACDGNPV